MFGDGSNAYSYLLHGFYMGVVLWGTGAFVEFCTAALKSVGSGPD